MRRVSSSWRRGWKSPFSATTAAAAAAAAAAVDNGGPRVLTCCGGQEEERRVQRSSFHTGSHHQRAFTPLKSTSSIDFVAFKPPTPVVLTRCKSLPARRSFHHTCNIPTKKDEQKETSPPTSSSSSSSPPSIVDIQPSDDDSTKNLYAEWSQRYEHDIRGMGYDMPEQVAQVLVEHNILPPPPTTTTHNNKEENNNDNVSFRILDAGCGDGLSGVALKQVLNKSSNSSNSRNNNTKGQIEMIGADVTPEMLDLAVQRGCYDKVVELNLNEFFEQDADDDADADDALWREDNSVDVICCVGTMTYVDPNNGPCLDEFVRIVKPGGYIIYTNRTDRLEEFEPKETALESQGKWKLVERKGPLPYLPGNPEYGTDVEVTIFLFQVL